MLTALKIYNKFAGIFFLKNFFKGFSIFVLFLLVSFFQFLSGAQLPIDSVKTNKSPADTTHVKKDSVINHTPLFNHGATTLISDYSFSRISKNNIQWTNYNGMYDILRKSSPAYPMSLGGFYNYNQLSYFGGSSRDNNFRFNNRQINELPFGSFNIDMFPTEFIENIEVFVGSDAVIFSGNSSGALINFQEPRYNTSTPYTKLWINESGTTFIASDGVFSQNIFPNTNFMFGFRKINSKGEFENQSADGWNIRGLLRFNLSDFTNISISENFYNHYTEMNAGVNLELSQDPFNSVDAVVNYGNFNDRIIKHDLSATMSSILDKDTTSALSLTIFSTFADYIRVLGTTISNELNDSVKSLTFPYQNYGATAKYEQGILNFADIVVGGDFNYTALDKNLFNDELTGLNYSAFGRINFALTKELSLSGGIRLNSQLNKFHNSFGGKIIYIPLKEREKLLSFFGDLSISQRIPTAAEGLGLKNEIHLLTIGGVNIKNKNLELSGSVWFRHISNPIQSRTISDSSGFVLNTVQFQNNSMQLTGFNFDLTAPISSKITFRVSSNFMIGNQLGNSISDFKSNTDFDCYYKITAGVSELRLGFELSCIFSNYRETFYPQKRVYVYLDKQSNFFYNGLNIYAHAKLGNTYFKLTLSNLLGSGYYYIATYPGSGRFINFTVNWPFLN